MHVHQHTDTDTHAPPTVDRAPKPLKFSMAELNMALEAVKMKRPASSGRHVT